MIMHPEYGYTPYLLGAMRAADKMGSRFVTRRGSKQMVSGTKHTKTKARRKASRASRKGNR